MISESFSIKVTNIEILAEQILAKYPDCLANTTSSGNQILFVIEKLYERVNANAVGVILVDRTGEDKCRISLYVGGGRRGLLQLDYGAEKHFFNEMKSLVLIGHLLL